MFGLATRPVRSEARRGRGSSGASPSEATSSSRARAPSSRISSPSRAKETFKRGATRSRAAGASRAVRGETHREIARARDARGAAEHGGASASGGGEHRVRSTAMVNERWSRQLSTETYWRFRCLRGKSAKNRRVVRPSFRSTSVGPRHPALSGRVSADQRVRAFSRRGSFS